MFPFVIRIINLLKLTNDILNKFSFKIYRNLANRLNQRGEWLKNVIKWFYAIMMALNKIITKNVSVSMIR